LKPNRGRVRHPNYGQSVFAVGREIRNSHPDCKILLLTGSTEGAKRIVGIDFAENSSVLSNRSFDRG
jgi:hypothetical protein